MGIERIIATAVLILALITISTTTAAALFCDCGDICVNETGWWRDDGVLNASTTPIQAAISNANEGETICVSAGNYTENVNVNKRLTLRGEGADLVTVNAASLNDYVFDVTAHYVNISGFKATGATGSGMAGIYLRSMQNCNILENNCSNNYWGICLYDSSNNTLVSNNYSDNVYGIYMSSSNENLIYNNYLNNTANAHDTGNNQWNITKTAGTNIIGGLFLGGNYWSDYAVVDNDGDGLGNTMLPYNSSGGITNDGDYHPLVSGSAPETTYIPPCPINLQNTNGEYWVNYTWSPGTGNVTDSYNVNLNGIWTNGTTDAFVNTSVGPEGWANITVIAYNASGTGTESATNIYDNVQAPAGPIPTPTPTPTPTDTTPPAPSTLTNTTSNNWVNYTWTPGIGVITDGYNVSMNDVWFNTTETFLNSNVGAGNWSNITVWAWNATGAGNISATSVSANLQAPAGPETIVSYGKTVKYSKNVWMKNRALGEPDELRAIMLMDAKIVIELNETIPDCKNVGVWVKKFRVQSPSFVVGASSDGKVWTQIGSETCSSSEWTLYEFPVDLNDVKYIGISKPRTFQKLMSLDAVYAEG